MSQTLDLAAPLAPTRLAGWLLFAFAAGQLGLTVWHADASEVIVLGLVLLLWIVCPAALAMLLVARARSRVEAWLFLGAEAAVVASTVWVWIILIFVKTGHANSEFAVSLVLLPVVQFAVLLVYAAIVIASVDLVMARNRQHERPRIMLLTILSLSGIASITALAWVFGYIRA